MLSKKDGFTKEVRLCLSLSLRGKQTSQNRDPLRSRCGWTLFFHHCLPDKTTTEWTLNDVLRSETHLQSVFFMLLIFTQFYWGWICNWIFVMHLFIYLHCLVSQNCSLRFRLFIQHVLLFFLQSIIFIRDRNARGQEISGYIDYSHRLKSEDFEPYFSGKKRLLPKTSDLR